MGHTLDGSHAENHIDQGHQLPDPAQKRWVNCRWHGREVKNVTVILRREGSWVRRELAELKFHDPKRIPSCKQQAWDLQGMIVLETLVTSEQLKWWVTHR